MKTFELSESALEWLKNGEKGISSETMFGAITGLRLKNMNHIHMTLTTSKAKRPDRVNYSLCCA